MLTAEVILSLIVEFESYNCLKAMLILLSPPSKPQISLADSFFFSIHLCYLPALFITVTSSNYQDSPIIGT